MNEKLSQSPSPLVTNVDSKKPTTQVVEEIILRKPPPPPDADLDDVPPNLPSDLVEAYEAARISINYAESLRALLLPTVIPSLNDEGTPDPVAHLRVASPYRALALDLIATMLNERGPYHAAVGAVAQELFAPRSGPADFPPIHRDTAHEVALVYLDRSLDVVWLASDPEGRTEHSQQLEKMDIRKVAENMEDAGRYLRLLPPGFWPNAVSILSAIRWEAQQAALRRERTPPGHPSKEDWLSATKAIAFAKTKGFAITLGWIVKRKGKIRTRPRQLLGKHKLEVEKNSLLVALANEAKRLEVENDTDEPAESMRAEIEERKNSERVRKQRDRSPD
jgi:hypothetical protein